MKDGLVLCGPDWVVDVYSNNDLLGIKLSRRFVIQTGKNLDVVANYWQRIRTAKTRKFRQLSWLVKLLLVKLVVETKPKTIQEST